MSKWYGSLTNRVMENNAFADVKIGDGATLISYSDRHAGTVVQMFTKGKAEYVVIQADKSKRTDKNGMSESQEYTFTPDPEGALYTFKLLPGRPWKQVRMNPKGRYVYYDGYGLALGYRSEYYDFSF